MKTILHAAVCTSLLLGFGVAGAQSQNQSVHHFVDAQGRQVTLTSGQPAPERYGPKPSFEELDRNHDGSISREEAERFPPLANDFDFLAHGGERISAREYAQWDYR